MAGQTEKPAMKLLVVELHHLGDAVMALPFVRAVEAIGEVHVCCRPGSVPIFQRLLAQDRIHPWSPPWHEDSRVGLLRAWSEMREESRRWAAGAFDAVSCVWADSRVHTMMALSDIPVRVGFPMNAMNYYAINAAWRRAQLRRGQVLAMVGALATRRRLLTHPLDRRSMTQHHLDSHAQIASVLNAPYHTQAPWFPQSPQVPSRRTLLIHTGGRLPTKRWPLAYFQQLLAGALARSTELDIWLVSGPNEPCPEPVASHQRRVNCATLEELIDLTGRADIVLCNDSLAGHLAAAHGKKVLAIFGSGNPDWFSPGGRAENSIGPAPCRFHPCVDVCLQPRILCLQDVSPDSVEKKLLQLLNA